MEGDNFGSWLQDLGGNGGAMSSRSMPGGRKVDKHKSQMDELAQEMKLLNWHKLANEAALKAALISTKKMKTTEKRLPHQVTSSFQSQEEKAQWMQQIIAEEQSKPLEVNADFISNYSTKEQREEERLETEVRRHIESLETLRKNLVVREDLKRRNREYRSQKEQLEFDKQTGVLGRNGPQSGQPQQGRYQQPESEAAFNNTGTIGSMDGRPKSQVSGTLSKVINSLDKLVELEKRISRLEANPGKLSANEGSATRAQMKFSKKRSIGSRTAPSKTYYSVQVSRNAKSTRNARLGATTGARKPTTQRQTNRNKFPQIRTQPQPRQNNYMKSSQRQQQNRVTAARKREPKKTKAEERMLKKAKEAERAERQDKLINKWMQDKKKKTTRKRTTPGARAAKGAASGVRNKNPHMQQFHEIRKQFEKKKQELRTSSSGGAPASGSALKAARQQKRDRTAPARTQSTKNAKKSTRLPAVKTSSRPNHGGGAQSSFPPSFGVGGTGIASKQAW